MADYYNISDCPITGLKRKYHEHSFLFDKRSKFVTLSGFVERYKEENGQLVYLGNSMQFPDYRVNITATNDTLVYREDGSFAVEPFDPAKTVMGEFDYFCYLETINIIVEDIKNNAVARHDSLGKFNN